MSTEFQKQKSGKVTFKNNGRGNMLSIGKIGKNPTSSIDNVYLIDGLKYNLLSISQLYDKGNCVWFDESQCVIENARSNDILLHGSRLDNVYAINLNHISLAFSLSQSIPWWCMALASQIKTC